MTPYGCVSTGDQLGMLEIVGASDTIANIQGLFGRLGALKHGTLKSWIQEKNPGCFPRAQDLFVRSCAGYCVASYVLGIGDRHSDNIMVQVRERGGRVLYIIYLICLKDSGFRIALGTFIHTENVTSFTLSTETWRISETCSLTPDIHRNLHTLK